MEHANLTDYVHFDDAGPARHPVFESGRLWAQTLCLSPKQSYGPVSDPEADALFVVVAGEAAFQVDRARKRLPQWGSVLVPADASVHVANASADPLVILVVTAPPPAAG
jgi:mannose-6-phosphate isomerase-like protein (cupin superfamily)